MIKDRVTIDITKDEAVVIINLKNATTTLYAPKTIDGKFVSLTNNELLKIWIAAAYTAAKVRDMIENSSDMMDEDFDEVKALLIDKDFDKGKIH